MCASGGGYAKVAMQCDMGARDGRIYLTTPSSLQHDLHISLRAYIGANQSCFEGAPQVFPSLFLTTPVARNRNKHLQKKMIGLSGFIPIPS